MSTTPNPHNWLTIISQINNYIPVFLRLIPLIFQIIGLLGVVWYSIKIIKYNTTKYNLAPLFKSIILFLFGLLLDYLLQLVK